MPLRFVVGSGFSRDALAWFCRKRLQPRCSSSRCNEASGLKASPTTSVRSLARVSMAGPALPLRCWLQPRCSSSRCNEASGLNASPTQSVRSPARALMAGPALPLRCWRPPQDSSSLPCRSPLQGRCLWRDWRSASPLNRAPARSVRMPARASMGAIALPLRCWIPDQRTSCAVRDKGNFEALDPVSTCIHALHGMKASCLHFMR